MKALEYYEKLYQIKYPLKKLDLISVHELGFRGMENWGSITFQARVLLNDPIYTPHALFEKNMSTITHEIGHMWFGNLVTMEWWTDIWLNEGFARLCENECLASIYPDLDCTGLFINEVFGSGIMSDAWEGTHPIEVEIKDPDTIYTIFDSISYSKGSSFI